MKQIEEKQKKVIKWFGLGLLLACVVALSITWLVFIVNDWKSTAEQIRLLIAWLFTNFGSIALGIFLKYIANRLMLKQNKKEIEQLHINYGLSKQWKEGEDTKDTKKDKKTPKNTYFKYDRFYFVVEKNGEIKICFEPKNQVDDYKDLKKALNEFIEKVRLDLPTQLI